MEDMAQPFTPSPLEVSRDAPVQTNHPWRNTCHSSREEISFRDDHLEPERTASAPPPPFAPPRPCRLQAIPWPFRRPPPAAEVSPRKISKKARPLSSLLMCPGGTFPPQSIFWYMLTGPRQYRHSPRHFFGPGNKPPSTFLPSADMLNGSPALRRPCLLTTDPLTPHAGHIHLASHRSTNGRGAGKGNKPSGIAPVLEKSSPHCRVARKVKPNILGGQFLKIAGESSKRSSINQQRNHPFFGSWLNTH